MKPYAASPHCRIRICQADASFRCLPELISQGVPVRLDPLGTFLPTCDVDKPLLNIPAMEGADPNNVVKGVHIRFLPYGVEDENITSRRFKEEYCSLEFRNIIDTQEVTVDGKKKKVTTLKPIATAIAEYKAAHGESGSTGNGSTDSGSQNSGSFGISGRESLSDEDVLTDKQDCQYPHGDGYALELACHDVTNHIRDDTYEDTVADAVS